MTARSELLIDAYNVMFAHPRIGPLARSAMARAREEFLVLVRSRRPPGTARIVVVFDAHRDPAPALEEGRTGGEAGGGVQVVYARETADVWIQRRIRDAAEPHRITIVTSDREILATARAHGAGVLPVRMFLQLPVSRRRRPTRAHDAGDKPSHLSKRQVAMWERLFRERGDADAEAPGDRPPPDESDDASR